MPTSGLKDLVRNPLGIVALFISLIYGVASLLLGATASSLQPDERMPLIAFVTLFPLIVLGAFYLLVTRHHGKLYAPGDFKDDGSFLRTLSKEEVELKRQAEVTEALPSAEPSPELVTLAEAPSATAGEAAAMATPNVTRARTIDAAPNISSFSQMFDDVRRTEDGVIVKLEKEFGKTATRNIEIAKAGVSFDAFLPGGSKPTFAEVKLVSRPMMSPSLLDRVLYSALLADRTLNGQFKLILVVVYAFTKQELPRMERAWRQKVEKCPVEIEMRFIARDDIDA